VYCNICGEYCPTKAIEVDPASRKVEIDPYSCVHCMICEQLCPKGVIKTFHIRPPNLEETANIPTSSQSERPAWWHISPLALREVAFLEKISRLHVEGSIDIDTDKCVYCGLCELSCPTRAIQVTKPFDGHISIKTAKCQKECSDCINICPSGAIERRKGIVVINEDACIYCGICCRVCPSEAIDFERRSAGIIDNKGNLIMHI
jgi:NAD-dependent dihydropyrimidine dehydrogenase PreA subunit